MKSTLRANAAVCLTVAALFLVALAPPGASTALPASSLRVSPGVYVGGQAVTFDGNIGVRGIRNIHLQINMGGSNTFTDLPGSRATTRADGSFHFQHPAPSMFGIRVRVASGRAATPAVTLDARSQDLTLRAPDQVTPGQDFSIEVDTTPVLPRRPDLPPPVFPGRTLTLQKRVADPGWLQSEWQTLDSTVTDQNGNGRFEVTESDPGTVVYRVRQGNWTRGENEIGWFPSFPTFVEVVDPSRLRLTASPSTTTSTTERTGPVPARTREAVTTASQKYGWRPALWDFGWESGESLTTRPYRGTTRRGWWLDSSDGTGRAAKHNGGLMLDSQRGVDGPGDFGTTAATLRGNPRAYGRWETKLRLKSPETNAQDYHVKIELVPDRPADYHCGGQNITVADLTPHGSSVRVGARAFRANSQWTARAPLGSLLGPSATFSVEVARGHISWFVNGRVIANVRNQAAVSDVPMTLQLSLVGQGQEEMNRAQVISDWQRGFSLDRGRKITSGNAPRRDSYTGGC
ncbi:MAG TPA: hypothetical protein VFY58_02575 [Nocardioides sp.]|nr:hypothetical protein [Nocardioides sp.]